MDINALYNEWLEKADADPDLKVELENIKGNDDEILDRFYRSLEFGTAGLRGVIGAGTNRMNVYTVGRATQGLADYLNDNYDSPSVAIDMTPELRAIISAGSLPRFWRLTELRFIFMTNLNLHRAFPMPFVN